MQNFMLFFYVEKPSFKEVQKGFNWDVVAAESVKRLARTADGVSAQGYGNKGEVYEM